MALSALREGRLPLRVTHNDTKLNNVLIDRASGKGVCVIDLDTVMPGLSINDFGDSIRFGANHSAEDERDLSKVNFDISLFDVYAAGFLEGAAGALTEAELDYLPWGAKLMTLECGIRFLPLLQAGVGHGGSLGRHEGRHRQIDDSPLLQRALGHLPGARFFPPSKRAPSVKYAAH